MITKEQATKDVLEYILYTEWENYVTFCYDNMLNPYDITGINHVYAKALVGLGLKFEPYADEDEK